jgi:hypothetical protein
MARTWRDDELPDIEMTQGMGWNGIVSDHGDLGSQERKGLIKVPGEGVEVIDQEDVNRLCQSWRQAKS